MATLAESFLVRPPLPPTWTHPPFAPPPFLAPSDRVSSLQSRMLRYCEQALCSAEWSDDASQADLDDLSDASADEAPEETDMADADVRSTATSPPRKPLAVQ